MNKIKAKTKIGNLESLRPDTLNIVSGVIDACIVWKGKEQWERMTAPEQHEAFELMLGLLYKTVDKMCKA